jgi:DNA polymerase III subunit beta
MQISVLQENLAKGLNSVIKAIESRPPLPVLANVLLEAEDSRLRIAASNLQMSITVWIGAKVDRPGTITLPAKTFADLVGRLSKERVDLTLDESTSTVTVKCGSTVSNIKGIASTEYPPIKQSDEAGIVVQARALKSMILQTAFAAAKEDNRPILTGVYTQVDKDVLTLAAADGYRLAVRTARLDEVLPKKAEMVIPARTMLEVARLMDDENQPVSISLPNKNNIVTFRLPNVDISSQILEGRFPDFAAIIPQRYITQSVIDTQDWLKKCQTAEIFARDDAHSGRLVVKPPKGPGEPGELIVAGRSAERGNADNSLTAHVEGESLDLHFDIRFLIEVLNVIDEDQVVFQSNGSDSPGVIRPQGREDFVHVIMPMTR